MVLLCYEEWSPSAGQGSEVSREINGFMANVVRYKEHLERGEWRTWPALGRNGVLMG